MKSKISLELLPVAIGRVANPPRTQKTYERSYDVPPGQQLHSNCCPASAAVFDVRRKLCMRVLPLDGQAASAGSLLSAPGLATTAVPRKQSRNVIWNEDVCFDVCYGPGLPGGGTEGFSRATTKIFPAFEKAPGG